ncbi:MAG TPA: BamA/TamA family outer membrane protein [Williamwhitmania sp.]|nr:BamA/TamA family outer membrane protein [Williamwhitmania sp.]
MWKNNNRWAPIAIGLLSVCVPLFSQVKPVEVLPDSISHGQNSFLVIPTAIYAPETRWAFGLSSGYYFSKDNSRKVSNIQGDLTYTLNDQFKASISPKVFSDDKRSFYSGRVVAMNYPDKFYGIGRHADSSQNYTWKNLSFLLQRQKVIFADLMLGVQMFIDYGRMKDSLPLSRYANEEIRGNGEYLTAALGALATWDSRDNMFFARTGSFYKLSLLVNSKIFLSDCDYSRFTIDIREFGLLTRRISLGFQYFGDFTWGEVPFQRLPMEGGYDILRGVRQGRYRDKMMMATQLELRANIFRRLYATTFIAAADVAPVVNEFLLKESNVSFGGGFRYRLNKAGVNLRFDTGYSPGGKPLYYFTALEAF